MSPDVAPCPAERDVPLGAPGPVDDAERVLRFVPVSAWLVWDPQGRPRLAPAAFPREELRGDGDKSVSVLRDKTPKVEVVRRAAARNREPTWGQDPVTACAPVQLLRQIQDNMQRREVCVNADPVEDALGFCPTHASVLRACPPLDMAQRLAWTVIRTKLADQFTEVAHCSGQPVTQVNSSP